MTSHVTSEQTQVQAGKVDSKYTEKLDPAQASRPFLSHLAGYLAFPTCPASHLTVKWGDHLALFRIYRQGGFSVPKSANWLETKRTTCTSLPCPPAL